VRFVDFLKTTVLLSAAAATALAAVAVIGAGNRGETNPALVSIAVWLVAGLVGQRLGRRAEATPPIGRLLASAKATTTMPEHRPATILINRLWPLLVPALLAVHLALPGSIGALTTAFLPAGGLVAQQESGAGTHGSGRLADVGPSLKQWERSPLLGQGYGTRVVDGPTPNASILDDQWLGTLLETGLVGVLSWIWLYASVLRRLVARARADRSNQALLCVGLTASILAYAVGMVTYDAFSFVQVTLVLYVLLGLSVAACHERVGSPRPAPATP